MIGPEVTVPDVMEAVIGYRTFHLKRTTQHNYSLISPHADTPWPTATMKAKCNNEIKVPEGIILPTPPKQHAAPHKDCGCGIYAYFDPNPVGKERAHDYRSPAYGAYYYSGMRGEIACVQALVSLSGKLEVHARGMRAASATICALGLNAGLERDEAAAVRELGRRWGVPVVDEAELEALSTEYGTPLDASMRPELPPKPKPHCAPTPIEHEIPWKATEQPRMAYVPTVVNLGAAAFNVGMMSATGVHPVNASCAAFSFALAMFFEGRRRQTVASGRTQT